MKRVIALSTALLMSCVSSAWAMDYNLINLDAEATKTIQNDLGFATLFVEISDADPARLAERVSATLSGALKQAKAVSSVKVETGGQQSYPVYNAKNRLEAWRARAELRLEGRDFAALSSLVGKLQASMQLDGLNFSVSPSARKSTTDELIAEALAAFRSRSELVAKSLGGKSYKVVSINIGQGGGRPMPVYKAMRAEVAAAPAMMDAPLEAGQSQLQVTVSGTIQVE